MCGSETLAMLVSSTSMKVAKVTASAIIHGFIAGCASGTAPRVSALLLIAWPEFPWVERERLIETAIQAAMQNVRLPARVAAS